MGRIYTSIDTQNSTVQLTIFEMTFTNDGNEAAVWNLDLNATLSMSFSISVHWAYIGGRFSSAWPCIESLNSLITCRVNWLIIAAQGNIVIVKSLVSRISIWVEEISLDLLNCGFKFLKDRCSFCWRLWRCHPSSLLSFFSLILRLHNSDLRILVLLDFDACSLWHQMGEFTKVIQRYSFSTWIYRIVEGKLKVVSLIFVGNGGLVIGLLKEMLQTLSIFDKVCLSQPSITVAVNSLGNRFRYVA